MNNQSSEKMSQSLNPDSLSKLIKQKGPAPVHLWDPPYCGEMDMRIARDGTWYHEQRPIRRLAMVKLFSSVLKREGGKYYLVTPVEKVGITVDDCPFVAQILDVIEQGDEQFLEFTLNTGEKITADTDHAIIVEEDSISGEPHPVIHVRNGLHALLTRNVFYQLVALAQQRQTAESNQLGVTSGQCFFEVG